MSNLLYNARGALYCLKFIHILTGGWSFCNCIIVLFWLSALLVTHPHTMQPFRERSDLTLIDLFSAYSLNCQYNFLRKLSLKVDSHMVFIKCPNNNFLSTSTYKYKCNYRWQVNSPVYLLL